MAEDKEEKQSEELTEKKEAPKLKVEVVEESPSETQEINEEIKEGEGSEDVKVETVEEKGEEKIEQIETSKEEKPQEESKTEEKTGSTKRFVVITLLVAGVVSLVVGGILRFRSSVEDLTPASPTPTSISQPTPTPTSEEEVVLSELSVQVLNGSGVAGRAGEVATALEDAGFEGIDTGNAETYDYTDTEVQVKPGTPQEVFDAIKETLTDYTVVAGDDLNEDSEFDVVVIVGEKN